MMEQQFTRSVVFEENKMIGTEGGVLTSTVSPQLQVEFPEKALKKPVNVDLRVVVITPELVSKHFGDPDASSPIVEVQPIQQKLHKPITLTIPFNKNCATFRLLCNYTDKLDPSAWKDISDKTPLRRVNFGTCVSFTSTVTARFWLVDCSKTTEVEKIAHAICEEYIHEGQSRRASNMEFRDDAAESDFKVTQSLVREDNKMIDEEGGVLSSTLHPQIQVEFPEKALVKPITVGLQVVILAPQLVCKHLGDPDASSPVVEILPIRRKLHKPITLTIPFNKKCSTFRLLCSFTDNSQPPVWEDVSNMMPLRRINDGTCVSFTSTVTARFWLVDCSTTTEVEKIAHDIYEEYLVEERSKGASNMEFPDAAAQIDVQQFTQSVVREERKMIGMEGGVLNSTLSPKLQLEFPKKALTKDITVGLEVVVIAPELVSKHLRDPDASSPIVEVQPVLRKLHKPITLTIPFNKNCSTFRLLCNYRDKLEPPAWKDITDNTLLRRINYGTCVSFTSKVTARFWLVHYLNITDVEQTAQDLYEEYLQDQQNKRDSNKEFRDAPAKSDVQQFTQSVVREERKMIGMEGGVLNSTLSPKLQVEFPKKALTKHITVGLEVVVIAPELVSKHLGNPHATSPMVEIQPIRRKLHEAITLTIPFNKTCSSFRLLCNYRDKVDPPAWKDISDKTPLRRVNDGTCVSFTSTVTARFWLIDSSKTTEVEKIAHDIYEEYIHGDQQSKRNSNMEFRDAAAKSDVQGDEFAVSDCSIQSQHNIDSASTSKSKTLYLEQRSDGLGFSVSGGGDPSEIVPVLVKEVFLTGAAAENGELRPGDQILAVNGESLHGLTYQQAVNILKHASGKVSLTVSLR